MPVFGRLNLIAVAFSLALHAGVFMLTSSIQFANLSKPKQPPKEQIVLLQVLPAPPKAVPPQVQESSVKREPLTTKSQSPTLSADTPVISPTSSKQPVSMAAPPPPSAEDWAFAGKYTNKNSKGYRYNWGQQVRSMMGTVVEGPDQGYVRFRIEIAPDGALAKLETIWTTSAVAEQLARKAYDNFPRTLLRPKWHVIDVRWNDGVGISKSELVSNSKHRQKLMLARACTNPPR